MRSVNKIILIGNVTRDPELKQTPNGQSVATFSIATNRDWITENKQRHSLPEYHDVVAWAKLADICGKYLKKGKLVYIEGYLKTRSWDDATGIKKFKTETVIQDMIMLDRKSENEPGYEEKGFSGENHPTSNQPETNPVPAQKRSEEKKEMPQSIQPKSISIDDDLGL